MTAEDVSSLSPPQRSPSLDVSSNESRFAQRGAAIRRALDDELIGLQDEELALIVSEGGEWAERAALILASRLRGLLVRVATDICRQLSHLGIRGLCQQVRCDEAFHSVYTSILRQTLGHDIRTDDRMEEALIDGGRLKRESTRQSACSRWLGRPDSKQDVSLAGWIGQELRQKGRAEDARRQWNKDRHLLQRMVLPATVEEALVQRIAEVRKSTQDMGRSDPFGTIGLEVDGKALHRIADRLYVDACDCWFSDEDIGFSRVARYLGLIEDREELTESIASVIALIDVLFMRASDDEGESQNRPPDNHFYERYFKAARRLTRTISRSTIDESRIVDDNLNEQFLDNEEDR